MKTWISRAASTVAICAALAVIASCSANHQASSPLVQTPSVPGVQPHVVQSSPPTTFIEFPIPTADSQPEGMAQGVDKFVYFTEFAGNKIGKIAQNGQITEFPIPTANAGATYIAPAGKFSLWFTEQSANQIGKFLIADGSITEFPIPTPASDPCSLVFYFHDQDFWFTEQAGNNVASITNAGTVTEYALPEPDSQPCGIIEGPNASIWFTETAAPRIGTINPQTGVIQEFPIPAPAQYIGSANDGNFYFTMPSRASLGEMTPAGVYVGEFPTGQSPSLPWGLWSKPSRVDIWYLDRLQNAVFSFNVSDRALTFFVAPTPSSDPTQITMSRDFNLWFTERAANKIGVYVRLRIAVTPQSLSFTSIGQQQSFSVTERKYTGLFTANGCNPSVATVSAGPATSFTVTAQGPGTCSFKVADTHFNSTMLKVTVAP